VRWSDAYVPGDGTSFQILSFADCSGGFSNEVERNMPYQRSLKPLSESDRLTVSISG
jgi:hypothetical protein